MVAAGALGAVARRAATSLFHGHQPDLTPVCVWMLSSRGVLLLALSGGSSLVWIWRLELEAVTLFLGWVGNLGTTGSTNRLQAKTPNFSVGDGDACRCGFPLGEFVVAPSLCQGSE